MTKINISDVGYGLMGFTWTPHPTPDEQAFEAMKASIDAGVTFWNAGSFYNFPDNPYANLKLIARYFTKYPEDAPKIVLSVKTCVNPAGLGVELKPEQIREHIDAVLKELDGKVRVGILEPARMDPAIPVEDVIPVIAEYVKAGKIDGIGLSEVGKETLKRANAVHPIAAVELEFSMTARHILEDGTAQVAAELGIPVIGYSPFSRGIVAGRYKTAKEGADTLAIFGFDQFKEDSLNHNWKLYDKVKAVADAKGATPAQVVLAWIKYQSGRNGNPQIVPIPGASSVARVRENFKSITLTDKEFDDLDSFVRSFKVSGDRYNEELRMFLSV
jgi:pyridoxine 4-dehydrogenase